MGSYSELGRDPGLEPGLDPGTEEGVDVGFELVLVVDSKLALFELDPFFPFRDKDRDSDRRDSDLEMSESSSRPFLVIFSLAFLKRDDMVEKDPKEDFTVLWGLVGKKCYKPVVRRFAKLERCNGGLHPKALYR